MHERVGPNEGIVSDHSALEELIGHAAPGLLFAHAEQSPETIAFRDKELGVYRGYSWREYADWVRRAAHGLAGLGVEKGDRVAIMGDACPEWMVADVAVTSLGAITVGIYPTSAPSEVEYLMNDSGARVFVAETQEHLDKLLAVEEQLPALERIVVIDTRALFLYDHELVMSLEQLVEQGDQRARRYPGEVEEATNGVAPHDPAAIVYTSGTTGAPKGAVLTHRNMLAGAVSYINCNPAIREREHRIVAHLPLSHVVARVLVVYTPLVTRLVPFFCEEINEFAETVREVAPDFVGMPPRFYEKFGAQLEVGVETTTPLKRKAYQVAWAVGARVLRRRRAGASVPPHLHVAHWLARQLVFRQLLEKVGFSRLEIAFTGSASMPLRVVDVWQTWGVDLREIYGVTECCGISIGQYFSCPPPGDVGTPASIPGFEFRLSDQGELLLRSPMVFKGYWGRPEATAEVLDQDGWYHTGDIAEMTPEARIKLVDRMKDIIITSGGKSLSPQQIEKVIKGSPYISEAVVFGDGRSYVTALLELDYTTVSEWARALRVPYTSYTNLVGLPEVQSLVEKEIETANGMLARVEQIKQFRIIPLELDPEQGETTPTRKIKRSLMYEMFEDLVESMYGGSQRRQSTDDSERAKSQSANVSSP